MGAKCAQPNHKPDTLGVSTSQGSPRASSQSQEYADRAHPDDSPNTNPTQIPIATVASTIADKADPGAAPKWDTRRANTKPPPEHSANTQASVAVNNAKSPSESGPVCAATHAKSNVSATDAERVRK
jgi:hypothetical protein